MRWVHTEALNSAEYDYELHDNNRYAPDDYKYNDLAITLDGIYLRDTYEDDTVHRSVGEIYFTMKTYYPSITQKKVFEIISDLCRMSHYWHVIYCDDIENLVLFNGEWSYDKSLFNNLIYDYGGYIINNEPTRNKFTIYYFLKKLGYTTQEIKNEFKNYKLKQLNK
jgi:hypothetical protein